MPGSRKSQSEGQFDLRVGLILGFVVLGGCSPDAPPNSPEGAIAPRVHQVPSVEPASGATSALGAPSDSVPLELPPPRAALAPSPFHRVLARTGSVAEASGRRYWLGAEGGLVDLTNGLVLANCGYTRGHLLEGTSLWHAARFSPFSACPDNPLLSRFRSGKLELYRSIDAHQLLTSPWLKSSTLAAIVPHRLGPPWGYELLSLEGGVKPPRPQKGATGLLYGEETECYSQLQQPVALYAFPGGEIFVFGQQQCDLLPEPVSEPTEQESEETEEKERELSRPVLEFWKAGAGRSALQSLPLQEIRSTSAPSPQSIWILGTALESHQPAQSGAASVPSADDRVLVHFDGSRANFVSGVDVSGVDVLISRGHQGRLTDLWTLSGGTFHPLVSPEGDATADCLPLTLPDSCASPWSVWFEEPHVWLICEEGLYSTDAARSEITFPVEHSLGCEAFEPQPEYEVPGLFKRPSSSSCGGRPSAAPPPVKAPSEI